MTTKIITLDEYELHRRIAVNIAYYRKLSGLTQSQLAERINYSDKSVSKWEHAAGVPGIHVLTMLAELFGVTVNDLISENAPLPTPDPSLREKRRVVTCLQLVVAVWLAATALFACLMIFAPSVNFPWLVFVAAVPASCAVCVVFSALWWGHLARLLSVSALAWTTAACAFLYMLDNNFAFLIFMVCAVAQVLVLLWYIRGRLADKSRRVLKVDGNSKQ
ncbi:MAG: helix-turn-helix transcriptional regulator [Clostridiales bacterium]|nr:helix-turn-helix transcriptional regulator [Clostridiales bacterium]